MKPFPSPFKEIEEYYKPKSGAPIALPLFYTTLFLAKDFYILFLGPIHDEENVYKPPNSSSTTGY